MNTESVLPVLFELFAKSVLITLVAALLARGWRKATAAQRHLVWLVALATVMLLPLTRLIAPRWAIPLQPAKKVTVVLPALPPISVASIDVVPLPSIKVAPPSVQTLPDWRKILLGAWLSGTVCLLGYRLFGSWRLHRLLRRSASIYDPRIRLLLSRTLSELHLARRPEIRLSEECRVPITWGSLRPVMLLPKAALVWNDAWLIAALRHEAAHIRRYDYLTRWFAHMACAVYWPNPLVWLLARSLRVAQELAADDLVLRAGTPPEEYATQLVDAARNVVLQGFFARQAVAMACPSTLEDRIRAIVDSRRDRRPLSRFAAACGSLAIALTLGLSTAAQLRSDEQKMAPAPATSASTRRVTSGPEIEIESKFIEITTAPGKVPPSPPEKPAIYSDPQFQVIIRALNQKKGVNLLSSPRVTTADNQRAVMEIIREFRYPTAWEKDGKKWKPTKSDLKNVGITLDITPRITPDGAIELHVVTNIVEFKGFVDLDNGGKTPAKEKNGTPIVSEFPPVPAGHRSKPVFSERKSDKTVTLESDETVEIFVGETADVQHVVDGKTARDDIYRRQTFLFISPRILNLAPPKKAPKDGAASAPANTLTVNGGTLDAPAEGPARRKAETTKMPNYLAGAFSNEVNVTGPADGPLTKEWKIPPDMIPSKPGNGGSDRISVKDWLISKGVIFDGGATAIYVPATSRLIMRNTPEQLDRVDHIVSGSTGDQGPATAGATQGTLTIAGDNTLASNDGAKLGVSAEGPALSKAKKIIIPQIELRNATIIEVLDFLRAKAVALDPEGKGVNIVLKPGTVSEASISLSLTDIPLIEAMKYVTGLANLEFVAEGEVLVVQPLGTEKTSPALALKGTGQQNDTVNAGISTLSVPAPAVDSPALAKARKIIIPQIEFREATIAEALDFFRKKALELDPDKAGVNLLLKPGAVEGTSLTMSLRDVPLLEALHYVASLANLELRAEPNALMLQPPVNRAKGEAQPTVAPDAAPSLPSAESAALNKAQKIILPKIETREATLPEMLDFLRTKAAELDPEKSGVNIVLKPGTKTDARITVSLTDIPLSEALRYVASLSELELRAEPNALVIGPPTPDTSSKAKVEVTADTATFDQKTGSTVFTGDARVKIVRPGEAPIALEADKLKLAGTPKPLPTHAEPDSQKSDAKTDAPTPPESATEAKGIPVPNHPGYITSPFAPKAGMIDVTGFAAGTRLKCPYTGKVIIVP